MAGSVGNDIYYVDTATTLQYPTFALISLLGSPKLPVVLGDRIIDGLNQGNDTVRASINYSLDSNLERLELIGKAHLAGAGNGFANTLVGNVGNNRLSGLAGNDSLLGKAGNDTLVGGTGRDAMEGNAGSDTFDFNRASDSRVGVALRDHIIRFSHADGDKIDLRSIDALAGGTDNAFVFIGSKSFAAYDAEHAGVVGMVRAFGGVVQIDIGGDRTVDMEIQVSGLTRTTSDFIL
jgi:Ca2+-binding RTX toxin-like protein